MKDLVLGDCHFGVKTNSIQWLETQLNFFRTAVYDAIEKANPDRLIFVGDVFDVRYSINQQVGYEVKVLIREMTERYPMLPIYIVAGNHDYYSPEESAKIYNSYNLIFGYEFLAAHPTIKIINDDYLYEDNTLFAPWYWTENNDNFNKMMDDLKDKQIDVIYCHSDLGKWSLNEMRSKLSKDTYVLSGHIHYRWDDKTNNLYNIGALFQLTFSDVNQDRYIVLFNTETKDIVGIKNTTTPKFLSYKDEEIFTISNEDLVNNYVRVYINTENINKARYIERLVEIKKNYEYLYLKIIKVENDFEGLEVGGEEFNTNIDEYIEVNIPDGLREKYEHIKEIIKSKD